MSTKYSARGILKRQVKYEQDKIELVFEACQQLYKKHAAEKSEIRMMARYINASLAMAKEAGMSGMGRMTELGVEWEASKEANTTYQTATSQTAHQRMMGMQGVLSTSAQVASSTVVRV